jgi:hypothetical protein
MQDQSGLATLLERLQLLPGPSREILLHEPGAPFRALQQAADALACRRPVLGSKQHSSQIAQQDACFSMTQLDKADEQVDERANQPALHIGIQDQKPRSQELI